MGKPSYKPVKTFTRLLFIGGATAIDPNPSKESQAMIYVSQDGADFYVYASMDDYNEGCSTYIATAPFKVKDGDMHAAECARFWFNEYGYFRGAVEVIWL